jgi:hypothetical protein
MNENKNISSKLDGLFENARNERPVISLNEVSDLLKNPSGYQRKKESHTWKWFGAFLFIGLSAFGAYFLLNNDSAVEKKSVSPIAIDNNSQPDNSIVINDASIPPVQNESSVASEKKEPENNPSQATLAENSGENKSTSAIKPAPAPLKAALKPEASSMHYSGNANINFSSGDKKINMVISPSNEIEQLKIDDELIAEANYKQYKSVIDEGLKLKNEKLKSNGSGNAEEQSLSSTQRNIMNAMMQQLAADGLVSSDKPFDFTLTGQEVILDNQKQSPETFEKYKGLYEKVTGEKLPAKYNLHIKR